MSREVTAGLLPLFDRLGDEAPPAVDGVLLDASGLQASLARDLFRLFNTRNGLTPTEYLEDDRGVLGFGLPDLTTLWPSSKVDRDLLEAVVRRALALYEPRLKHVSVQARPDPASKSRALLMLSAAVMVGRQMRRVDFRLDVQSREGAVQVLS